MNKLSKKHYFATIILILALMPFVSRSEDDSKDISLEMREKIEWCGMRHIDANKDDLPRVLMVGDSIVGGYADKVSKLLEGKAYCSWITTSRCLGDPIFEMELELMLSQYDYEVIHFNNGLHGRDFSIKQYATALDEVFQQLIDTDAAVIWRTTTPISPNSKDADGKKRVNQRNTIAAKLAKKHDIEIHDLGALTKGKAEYYSDSVHYKAEATTLQAEQVADTIKKSLK